MAPVDLAAIVPVPGNSSQFRRLDYQDFGHLIIDDFLDTIQGRTTTPLIPARAVLPSIRLLEECYRCATRMSMPWVEILPE